MSKQPVSKHDQNIALDEVVSAARIFADSSLPGGNGEPEWIALLDAERNARSLGCYGCQIDAARTLAGVALPAEG